MDIQGGTQEEGHLAPCDSNPISCRRRRRSPPHSPYPSEYIYTQININRMAFCIRRSAPNIKLLKVPVSSAYINCIIDGRRRRSSSCLNGMGLGGIASALYTRASNYQKRRRTDCIFNCSRNSSRLSLNI